MRFDPLQKFRRRRPPEDAVTNADLKRIIMSLQDTIDRIAKDESRLAALVVQNIQATTAIGASQAATAALVSELAKAQGIDTSAAEASLAEVETAIGTLTTSAQTVGIPVAPAEPAADPQPDTAS